MRARIVSLALEIGWMVPWLFVLHAGGAWWVPLAAALALLFISTSPQRGIFGSIAVLASLVVGFLFGSGFGLIAGGIGAWRGWAAHGTQPRSALLARLVMVLVALAVLVIWHPGWWPVLPGALLLAVAGMAEAARPPGVGSGEWWGLGSALGLVATGMALVIYVLAFWGPWKHLAGPLNAGVSLAVEAIAYTIVRLLSQFHFHGLHVHGPHIKYKSQGHKSKPTFHAAGGHHLLLLIVLGIVGAAIVGFGVWWLSRALADWSPKHEEEGERLERERLPDRDRARASRQLHTRRVVQRRLYRAFRRKIGAESHETLREWFRRVHGSAESPSVALYEEVRYGEADDSASRAAQADRSWPAEPERRRGG